MPNLPRIKKTQRRPRAAEVVVSPREPRLAELHEHGLTWVHLTAPTAAEAEQLQNRFGWHPLDLEDVLSKRQRPKIDEYPELHLRGPALSGLRQGHPAPERRRARRLPRRGLPRDAPDGGAVARHASLPALLDDAELRESLFSKGSGYLFYHVLDDLFDYCFPILDKIGHKLDTVEDEMFEGRSEEVVRDISNVKQEIISYRKIIKPERATLRVLERQTRRFLPEELEVYFDDIVDAAERIWDLLDNYKEVVEGLESTNESVISHRQNDILRVLTIFSVVLLPLTLITGIFGMNVDFPGFDTSAAWWAIVGVMVGVLVACSASSATRSSSSRCCPSTRAPPLR